MSEWPTCAGKMWVCWDSGSFRLNLDPDVAEINSFKTCPACKLCTVKVEHVLFFCMESFMKSSSVSYNHQRHCPWKDRGSGFCNKIRSRALTFEKQLIVPSRCRFVGFWDAVKYHRHSALQRKYVSISQWLCGAFQIALSDYKIPLSGNTLQNNSEMLLRMPDNSTAKTSWSEG